MRPLLTRAVRPALPHLLIIALLLVLLYPVAWMLGSSFKSTDEIVASLSFWPRHFTPGNFAQGWAGTAGTSFAVYFMNSTLIAVGAVIGNMFSCSITAYAMARLEFRGRALVTGIAIGTLLLPKEILLIPQYLIFHQLGWVDTDLPLVLPKFLAVDAFFLFLNLQFMRGLPRELDEAAALDGCGPFRTFWHILLPLMKPAMATTAIFTFIWTWNDYFSQLIYLNSPARYTLPVGLRMFLDATSGSDLGPMFAMATVTLAPLLVLFVLFQRHLVQGIATTGFKG
ncbi:carbohydrate ABC transporter permease [Streptacidiphilus carbonis]|uniref:carbohydrate ABC transporter permease n=1 Tax=Streptacidiphilus carbonis TaxID=105422 RepID=UPI0005A96258|nr:carbohydrate ABC transporter permease [Streptacidiphilus carbonis]